MEISNTDVLQQYSYYIIVILLFMGLLGVGYVSLTPGAGTQPFSEFYLLNESGVADEYPSNLTVGEQGSVIVGITNNENEPMTYDIIMRLDNESIGERTVTLEDGQTREEEFSFSLEQSGEQTLQFLLYKGGDAQSNEPDQTLRLLLNISA